MVGDDFGTLEGGRDSSLSDVADNFLDRLVCCILQVKNKSIGGESEDGYLHEIRSKEVWSKRGN